MRASGRTEPSACGMPVAMPSEMAETTFPKSICPAAMSNGRPSNARLFVRPVTACFDAVFYMASLPLSANVLQMTVMASKMPLVGRG